MEIISLVSFNKTPLFVFKFSTFLSVFFLLFFSCKKAVEIDFSDRAFSSEKNTIVSVIMPKALGRSSASKNINDTLEQFACKSLHIDASKEHESSIENSAKQFDVSYVNFKKQISNELSQELPKWEAHIDGEITFKHIDLISIAMNSSINTGSAKSNLKIKFFNFDPLTGKTLSLKDLVSNVNAFKQLVKKYYDKELLTGYTNIQSSAKNKAFKLPKSIGFSDDGVIIFYNSYELLLPAAETIEFTIPYEAANEFLAF